MDEEITKLLLVGLTKAEFIAYFIWGVAGMLGSFGANVIYKTKVKTKQPWSWKKFWSGGMRLGLGLLWVAIGVVFFEKVAGIMLASEAPIQLTAWGSLTIVGFGSDRIGKTLSSFMQGKK